jgi:hypothetical protein
MEAARTIADMARDRSGATLTVLGTKCPLRLACAPALIDENAEPAGLAAHTRRLRQ